jgi:hypothetical protein
MKKYAVILTCMTLGLTLSFAQNDPTASDADAAQPSIDAAAPESSADAANQSDTTESAIVAEPAGAGQQQEVGTIVLQGTVQTAEEKNAIEEHLKSMPGINKIDNKLTVVGEISDPAGAEKEAEEPEAESTPEDTQATPDSSLEQPPQNP